MSHVVNIAHKMPSESGLSSDVMHALLADLRMRQGAVSNPSQQDAEQAVAVA